MSKTLWWVAGAVGVVWLLSQDGGSPSAASRTPAHSPTYAPSYSPPATAGVSAGYGYSAAEDEGDDPEAEERAEEVRQAKQEFEDAADELRSAVNGLRYNRWDGQMSTIRSRLEDADDALGQLEALRPDDPAVQNARDEVDSMRSHLSRLHHENWRTVRPDLDTSSSAIEDEAASVSEDEDED